MQIVGIDLGSNTLRAICYDCSKNLFLDSFEKMVKSADKLVQTGKISDEAVERIIVALKEADQKLDFKSKTVCAKTTAALRRADNSKQVLAMIKEQTGIDFEVIDAQKEAYYTQVAVKHRMQALNITDKRYFLIDIGGGSTELIFVDHEQFEAMSIDVGIVTMSQSFSSNERLIAALHEAFKPLETFVAHLRQTYDISLLVATAGTPTTIASMKLGMTTQTYDANRINGSWLWYEDLNVQLQRLLSMTTKDRALHVGVGRDELIIVGVEMVKALYNVLNVEKALIIDDGMREGIAISGCKEA